MRTLGLVAWTVAWPVIVFIAASFLMMGDPVEGGYQQQQIFGRGVLLGGGAIFLLGYWLILRRPKR